MPAQINPDTVWLTLAITLTIALAAQIRYDNRKPKK